MQHKQKWLAIRICKYVNEIRIQGGDYLKACGELRAIRSGEPLQSLHPRTLMHLQNRYHNFLQR